MFKLAKDFAFEASHALTYQQGSVMHSHAWHGRLVVKGARDLTREGAKRNMVLDYTILGEIAARIEGFLQRSHLNDLLKEDMPTSEFMAKWIFGRARADLMAYTEMAFLESVSIEETCAPRCEYYAAG